MMVSVLPRISALAPLGGPEIIVKLNYVIHHASTVIVLYPMSVYATQGGLEANVTSRSAHHA